MLLKGVRLEIVLNGAYDVRVGSILDCENLGLEDGKWRSEVLVEQSVAGERLNGLDVLDGVTSSWSLSA